MGDDRGARVLEKTRRRKNKELERRTHLTGELSRSAIAPSTRVHLMTVDKTVSLLRPMIPPESPFMYRVYCGTVQRVPQHYSSLCSSAAFILVIDSDREVVGWFGTDCKLVDRKLASELGLEVLRHDLRRADAHHFPFTSEADEKLRLLRYILPKLWCDETTYKSKAVQSQRSKPCVNAPVSVGLLDKFVDGSFALREVSFAAVNENGAVPRLNFVPIEMNTIAVVKYAEQWDIWISRGCSAYDEDLARSYITRLAASRAAAQSNGSSEVTASALDVLKAGNTNIRIVKQGCERVLFRCHMKVLTDYEPPGKCVPWSPTAGGGLLSSALDDNRDLQPGVQSVLIDPFAKAAGGAVGGLTSFGGAVADVFSFGKSDVTTSGPGERVGGGSAAGGGGVLLTSDAAEDKARGQGAKDGVGEGGAGGGGDGAGGESKKGLLSLLSLKGDKPAPSFPGLNLGSKTARKGHPYEGRDMLTFDMLDLVDDVSLGVTKSNQVIEAATYEPFILVGYQIEIDEGLYRGRHVITATRKTLFQRSVFRLSSFDAEDTWIKLKRGSKVGIPFRVLRRVFDPM